MKTLKGYLKRIKDLLDSFIQRVKLMSIQQIIIEIRMWWNSQAFALKNARIFATWTDHTLANAIN